MPPLLRENLLRVLDACRRHGVFHPRIDADALPIDRARIDEALDHLRTGGFVEIADWFADKGQGYRLTAAGEAALADPRRLEKPAAPQGPGGGALDPARRRRSLVVRHRVRDATETGDRHAASRRVNIAVFLMDAAIVARQGRSVSAFLAGSFPDKGEHAIDFGQLIGFGTPDTSVTPSFRPANGGDWSRTCSCTADCCTSASTCTPCTCSAASWKGGSAGGAIRSSTSARDSSPESP